MFSFSHSIQIPYDSLLIPPSEFYQDSVISAQKAQLRSKAELQVMYAFCLFVFCHLAIRLVAHEKKSLFPQL